MDRRHFLKTLVLGLLAFGGRGLAAQAAPAVQPKTRPPGTCGGWTDAGGNGKCDRSEKADKPCGAVKCPGHVKNVARAEAEKNGAPAGTCALWNDSGKKGFCSVCEDAKKPCLYTVCPAHKTPAGQKT